MMSENKEMKVEALLPCPFCGGKAALEQHYNHFSKTMYDVGQCNNCWISRPYDKWQMRAIPDLSSVATPELINELFNRMNIENNNEE